MATRPTPERRRRSGGGLVGLVTLAAALNACTGYPGGSPVASPETTGSAGSASTPASSPSPSSSPAPTPSISAATTLTAAAVGLLEARSATVTIDVRRERRAGDPVETLVAGEGRVEPVAGRGSVRYDLTGLLAGPEAPTTPDPDLIVDVAWTADHLYARLAPEAEGDWQVRTRAEARDSSGLIGRLPDEVLGLVELVAAAGPNAVEPMEPGALDGRLSDRWRVRVPIEEAAEAGVPADAPDAATLRRVYGVEALDVEAWLVDGQVRRLRYEFARDEAPYGGPDRTITTYDWLVTADADPIVLPSLAAPSAG